MTVIQEMHLEDIEGNEKTMELVCTLIANGKCEEFDHIMDEFYPGGMTEAQIFWFLNENAEAIENWAGLDTRSNDVKNREELQRLFNEKLEEYLSSDAEQIIKDLQLEELCEIKELLDCN